MFFSFYTDEQKDKIIEKRQQMLESGQLTREEELMQDYRRFQAQFGVGILESLHGEDLIETIFNVSNKDSLAYWLEFKKDEDFNTRMFGSIAGGVALKYIMYKRKADQKWVVGHKQQELRLNEAIRIGSDIRDAILRGAELIRGLEDLSVASYETLQRKLDEEPEYKAGRYGWIHKYYHMLFPETIDQYHSAFYHQHILLCLGIKPVSQDQLYPLTGQMIQITKELPMPTLHAEHAIGALYGPPINYFRIGTRDGHSEASMWDLMYSNEYVSIGWKEMGDLQAYRTDNDGQTRKNLRNAYEALWNTIPSLASRQVNEMLRFLTGMQVNDLVAACDGETLLGVGRVTGEYEYFSELDFPHIRPVEWLYAGRTKLKDPKENNQSTMRQYKNFDNILNLRELAASNAGITTPPVIARDDKPLPPLDETVRRIEDVLKRKSQVILYGPPGTGKTYYAEKAARELSARKHFRKPFSDLNETEKTTVTGDGRNSGFVRVCCFHPSYGYEDFIEGIKPKIINNNTQFELTDGIFKSFCKEAAARPENDFFLIIDEINRGDISRIFGELIMLVEHNKRGKALTLPVSGESFQIPRNIYIIGTMNTADRSIALLDTALRRRFGFIEFLPEYGLLSGAYFGVIPLAEWLKQLNERICRNLGRDARNLQIGHSYFMKDEKAISSVDLFRKVLSEDILPLIEEYCYGDYGMMAEILGTGIVDRASQTLQYQLFEGDFSELENALLQLCPGIQRTGAEPEDTEPEDDEQTVGDEV